MNLPSLVGALVIAFLAIVVYVVLFYVAIGLWMLLGVLIGFGLFYLIAWFYG